MTPSLDDISWNDVALVAAVAPFASLRQAAKAMDASVSTVVRRIESLEQSLGASLLDRTPSGFTLNASGHAVAQIGKDMRRHFLRLQSVAADDERVQGEVSLGATEGLAALWLAPRLPEFLAANRGLRLHLAASMEPLNPLRNEVDITLQLVRPDHADLVATRVCHLQVYPFASLAYIERHGLPSAGTGGRGHRIVQQTCSQFAGIGLDAYARDHAPLAEIAFVTNSSIAHFQAVQRGLGIGILPSFAMALDPMLVPIDLDFRRVLPLWLCYRVDKRRLKRLAVTVEWVRQVLNPRVLPWFGSEFMHPADVVAAVKRTDNSLLPGLHSRLPNMAFDQTQRRVAAPQRMPAQQRVAAGHGSRHP